MHMRLRSLLLRRFRVAQTFTETSHRVDTLEAVKGFFGADVEGEVLDERGEPLGEV